MKIILTGGGTAGHVTPNLALLPTLTANGHETVYVGAKDGIEKKLAEEAGLRFIGVSTGKLRRYFNFKSLKANVKDAFRVVKGLKEAISVMKTEKPDAVFSKGGFVSVPVVMAAAFCKIPVIAHESDITPGLANKIAYPFAKKICATFESTVGLLPKGKGVHTGAPVRAELLGGEKAAGRRVCGFKSDLPTLLIMGGSSGSVKINKAVEAALPELLQNFNVVHLRGKGNLSSQNFGGIGEYRQFEYLSAELPDVLALSDVVVSRAGSSAINELLALKKPNLLVPLSKKASRGDQILNAEHFKKRGFSRVLDEESLTGERLAEEIRKLREGAEIFMANMAKAAATEAVALIVREIESAAL